MGFTVPEIAGFVPQTIVLPESSKVAIISNKEALVQGLATNWISVPVGLINEIVMSFTQVWVISTVTLTSETTLLEDKFMLEKNGVVFTITGIAIGVSVDVTVKQICWPVVNLYPKL